MGEGGLLSASASPTAANCGRRSPSSQRTSPKNMSSSNLAAPEPGDDGGTDSDGGQGKKDAVSPLPDGFGSRLDKPRRR